MYARERESDSAHHSSRCAWRLGAVPARGHHPVDPDFIADGMYLSRHLRGRRSVHRPGGSGADECAAIHLAIIASFSKRVPASMWPRAKIPDDFRDPVSSNVPVLIFSGNMDPVTPPQRGEEVANYLPNSRHVIIPEGAHGPFGLTNLGCVDRIIIDFMDEGDVKDLDLSCIKGMAPPPFATSPSTISRRR